MGKMVYLAKEVEEIELMNVVKISCYNGGGDAERNPGDDDGDFIYIEQSEEPYDKDVALIVQIRKGTNFTDAKRLLLKAVDELKKENNSDEILLDDDLETVLEDLKDELYKIGDSSMEESDSMKYGEFFRRIQKIQNRMFPKPSPDGFPF